MVIILKIVGTIVEYNPLHNGHAYAIEQIKKQSQADVIIAVMSGDFTMRGELSLFNKFEKTNQALSIGIDLIIELPFPYTVQNSDLFSEYAIKLLNLCKVNEVWFGSESNNSLLYEKYYNAWKEIGILDGEGDYMQTFLNSDLLINECSFILEYFYSKHPAIHLQNINAAPYDKTSEKIINANYISYNNNDLKKYLDMLLVEKKDPKLAERMKLLNELNSKSGFASKNILDNIKRELEII